MNTCFAPCTTPAQAAPDPSKHVDYTLGMVLGVDEFTQEFAYQSGRDRFLARDLSGYGTVSGLKVTTDQSGGKTRVLVTAGVAVDPQGEIIRVPRTQCAVLDDWIAGNGPALSAHLGSPLVETATVYVVLSYRSSPADPVPIPGEPCRTADQSMAPSRRADDFQLALSLDRPAQSWVEAVREFALWLGLVEVGDSPGPFATLDQFEAAVRAAGQITSPLGQLQFPSPLSSLRVHTADAPAFFRAAYRIWVTELRPAWSNVSGGDPPPEGRVLLAELNVPLAPAATPGQWMRDAAKTVGVNEDPRPFLIPTQLAQEWLDRPSSTPAGLAAVRGQFDKTGKAVGSATGLTATPLAIADKTYFLLQFNGWGATARYLVRGAPLVGFKDPAGAFFAAIVPGDPDLQAALGAAPAGIVVRSGAPTGANAFGPVGFSVEITPVG